MYYAIIALVTIVVCTAITSLAVHLVTKQNVVPTDTAVPVLLAAVGIGVSWFIVIPFIVIVMTKYM